MTSAHDLVERMIAANATDAQRKALHDVLDAFPLRALETVANANGRIRPLTPGERFDEASPALLRLKAGVDAWPLPPAGLFVVEERTLYLRSMSPMTIAHEFGHALDMALGDGVYISSSDPKLQREWARADAFVTPYAASAKDEWFAEGFRSYVGVNDEPSLWPKVSRERLSSMAPHLAAFFDQNIGTAPALERMEPEKAADVPLAPKREPVTIELTLAPESSPEIEGGDSLTGPEPSKVAKRNEFYQQLTNDLVALIDRGGLPEWERFWKTNTKSGVPHNATTNANYRGVNTLRLWVTALERGYNDPRWMTVRQANSKGWAVRAGEIGTPIEVWKKQERYVDRNGNVVPKAEAKKIMDDPARKDEVIRRDLLIYRNYTVFNASQVDAVVKNKDKTTTRVPLVEHVPYNRELIVDGRAWDDIERAETMVEAVGITVKHVAGNRAYYDPMRDEIVLPHQAQFASASDYYDVKLHETGHGTGHKDRLNRPTVYTNNLDLANYAREELRAELTSFYLAAELGIPHNVERHGAYLEHWAGFLRDNHMEIYAAAKDAQAAVDFMLEREAELMKKREIEGIERTGTAIATGIEDLPISALALDGERDPLLVAYDAFDQHLSQFESVDIALSLGRLRTVLYRLVDVKDLSRADALALEDQACEIARRASSRIPVWHSISTYDAMYRAIRLKTDERVNEADARERATGANVLIGAEREATTTAPRLIRFHVHELTLPTPSEIERGEFRSTAIVRARDRATAQKYGGEFELEFLGDAARWAIRHMHTDDFEAKLERDGCVTEVPTRINTGREIDTRTASASLPSGDPIAAHAIEAIDRLRALGVETMEWPQDPTYSRIWYEALRPVADRDLRELRAEVLDARGIDAAQLAGAADAQLDQSTRENLEESLRSNDELLALIDGMIAAGMTSAAVPGWRGNVAASLALASYDYQERSIEPIRRKADITDLDPRIVRDIIDASASVLAIEVEDPLTKIPPLTDAQIEAIRDRADLADLDRAGTIIPAVIDAAHDWEWADVLARNKAQLIGGWLTAYKGGFTAEQFQTVLMRNDLGPENATLEGSEILVERPWVVSWDGGTRWQAIRDASLYATIEQQIAGERRIGLAPEPRPAGVDVERFAALLEVPTRNKAHAMAKTRVETLIEEIASTHRALATDYEQEPDNHRLHNMREQHIAVTSARLERAVVALEKQTTPMERRDVAQEYVAFIDRAGDGARFDVGYYTHGRSGTSSMTSLRGITADVATLKMQHLIRRQLPGFVLNAETKERFEFDSRMTKLRLVRVDLQERAVSFMLADDRTERMQRFVEKLRVAGESRDHVWSTCMNEIRALKSTYEITTVRRMMTEYRRAVAEELGGDHPAMRFLRAYRRDREAIELATRERIAERLEDRKAVDPEHVVAAAETLLASERWADRVAGVIIATGTRVPEVAAVGRFEVVASHAITFEGAVRGSAAARTIPTLVEADLIVRTVEALREQKPLGDRQVTSITASHTKPIAAAASAALGATYTATELRDLYATVAHEWYAKPDVSLTTYVAGVLGHDPRDATTALSHVRYYPEGKERETLDALERSRLELVAVTRDKLNGGGWSAEARQRIATELDYLEGISFETRDIAAPVIEADPRARLAERLDEAITLIEAGEPGAILAFISEELENTARPVANPTGRQVIAALRADGEIAGEVERTSRLTRAIEDAPNNARRALNTRQSARYYAERDASGSWVVRDSVTGAAFNRSALTGDFTPTSAASAHQAAERLNVREARETHAFVLTAELATQVAREPEFSLLPEATPMPAPIGQRIATVAATLARDTVARARGAILDGNAWLLSEHNIDVVSPVVEFATELADDVNELRQFVTDPNRLTKQIDASYDLAATQRAARLEAQREAQTPTFSLLPEVSTMPAPIGQRVTLYGAPTLTNMRETEKVAQLGLRQTTSKLINGAKQFDSEFYDVVAFGADGAALAAAARATTKDSLLRVEAIAHKGSYEKDGEKRRTTEFVVTKADVVLKSDIPKDLAKNEWLVAGTIKDVAVNERRTLATVNVNVDRVKLDGTPYQEVVTVKGFRENVETLAALKAGEQHEFAGKVAVEKSRDEKHRDPVLLVSRHGQDLGIRKALGVEQSIETLTPEQAVATPEQRSITNEARGEQEVVADEVTLASPRDANGTPVALDHVISDPAGRVVDRENLPYNLTGELVGQSPDGQHLYMDLGRGDLLKFDRDSFDVVPEFGKTYSFTQGANGRETATGIETPEQSLDREHEHDVNQEHAMA